MIYLDHNATTQTHADVREMAANLMANPLNPSAIHAHGRKAKSIIEHARQQIKELVNIDTKANYQVIFTSSGTEANNLAISSFKDGDIFISATEHMSIFALKEYLPNVHIIKVDSNGIVDLADLEYLLVNSTKQRKLISVMLANNETGVIQPVKEIAVLATKYKAVVHSDLIQAIGKIAVDINELGVSFASISAHKFGGLVGAAALIASTEYRVLPMIIGGQQERGMRSGSENVPAIAGMGLAAHIVKDQLDKRHQQMKDLQTRLEANLPGAKIIAKDVPRLPNTSLITSKGKCDSMTQLIAFDLRGFCLSSGAACSSGKVAEGSHVLQAMGVAKEEMQSAIRVSLSPNNTFAEVDSFIKAFLEINMQQEHCKHLASLA